MKVAKAKLIKRTTEDGNMEMVDDVPLGKVYRIDLDRLETVTMFNFVTGERHTKVMVPDLDYPGLTEDFEDGPPLIGWLPMDLLEVVSDAN